MVGCLANLYLSVENMDETYMQQDLHKDLLLKPSASVSSRISSLLPSINDSSSNEPYTCKVTDKSLLADSTDRECLQNEPKFMTLLSPYPNILQIFDVFEDNNYLSIVMDLCQPQTFFDRIVNDPISETQETVLIKSLLEGLAHCHRMGVAHCDIKPDNVLFDSADNLFASSIIEKKEKRRGARFSWLE